MSPIKTINIKIALEKKALLLLLSKKLSQYLSCNEIICRITLPLRWILKEKKLYGPFLWMGLNCLQAIEPLRRDSLLFITKSPEVPGTHLIDPGTHLIDLGRMKGWVDLGATQWFLNPEALDWESIALCVRTKWIIRIYYALTELYQG